MNDELKDSPVNSEDPVLSIANEYASIEVRKVLTGKGERLEIHSPRFGQRIRLDPVALEGIIWQHPFAFSRFLSNSIAPE